MLQTAAAALLLSAAGLLAGQEAAAAQAKKSAKPAEAAQKDTAAIQRAYAAGAKAFEGGDMAGAEQQLSVALQGGGLPNAQMARALYLRGSAYRRLGRPAQAISDLTTAIWLKGGLSETDKAKATEERQLAYREAGLGETPPTIGAAPLDQSPKAPGAPPPAAGAQVVQVTQQSFWNGFSLPSLTGSSQPAQPAAAAPPAAAPEQQQSSSFWSFLPSFGGSQAPAAETAAAEASVPAAGFTTSVASAEAAAPPAAGFAPQPEAAPQAQTSSWTTQTADAAAAAPQPAAAPSYAPAPEPAGLHPMGAAPAPAASAPASEGASWSNPLAGSGTAVSNFFGNVFGGGTPAAPQAEASPVTTGSTAATPGWAPDTTVVTAQTSSMVQRGPDSPPADPTAQPTELPWTAAAGTPAAEPRAAKPAKVAAAAAGGGKYKLQVAAVRSRAEAEKLAATLNGYPPVRDGLVRPEIDEAVIGSMGTFYRVRLGPYADAREPDQLCKTLRPQGFDCLVVTQ